MTEKTNQASYTDYKSLEVGVSIFQDRTGMEKEFYEKCLILLALFPRKKVGKKENFWIRTKCLLMYNFHFMFLLP